MSFYMSRSEAPLVLVVEDDPPMREFLRAALQAASYAVVAVEDGLDALRYLEADLPDAIILDLNLPRLHGRDVHSELKQQGLVDRVPVVIVTGTSDVLPVDEFSCVLRKPVDPDLLVTSVERALRSVRS